MTERERYYISGVAAADACLRRYGRSAAAALAETAAALGADACDARGGTSDTQAGAAGASDTKAGAAGASDARVDTVDARADGVDTEALLGGALGGAYRLAFEGGFPCGALAEAVAAALLYPCGARAAAVEAYANINGVPGALFRYAGYTDAVMCAAVNRAYLALRAAGRAQA